MKSLSVEILGGGGGGGGGTPKGGSIGGGGVLSLTVKSPLFLTEELKKLYSDLRTFYCSIKNYIENIDTGPMYLSYSLKV